MKFCTQQIGLTMSGAQARRRAEGDLQAAGWHDEQVAFLLSVSDNVGGEEYLLARHPLAQPSAAFAMLFVSAVVRDTAVHVDHKRFLLRNTAAVLRDFKRTPGLHVSRYWHGRTQSLLGADLQGPVFHARTDGAILQRHYAQVLGAGLSASSAGVTEGALLTDRKKRLARELAVGLTLAGVPASRFVDVLTRGGVAWDRRSSSSIVDDLLSHSEYRVVLNVEGTSQLAELPDKAGSVTELRDVSRGGAGAFSGWGLAAYNAHKSTRLLQGRYDGQGSTPARRGVSLSMVVQAPSHNRAALIAKRGVSELLDTYTAAHPWAQLQVGQQAFVGQVTNKSLQHLLLVSRGADSAAPTSHTWPGALRQSIRISTLLRTADAPMTRAALGWVALESAGVKWRKVDELAKGLALLAFRQQVVYPYRALLQDVLATQGAAEAASRAAERRRSAARRAKTAEARNVPPHRQEVLLREALDRRAAAALQQLLQRTAASEELSRRSAAASLAVAMNPSSNPGGPTYLGSVDAWHQLLIGPWETDLGTEACLLRAVLAGAGLTSAADVHNLSALLRDGHHLASEMERQQSWVWICLRMLYSARNMHLHAGTYSTAGDWGIGDLADRLLDSFYELVAPWFARDESLRLREDILAPLARRFDDMVGSLKMDPLTALYPLDRLTLPD